MAQATTADLTARIHSSLNGYWPNAAVQVFPEVTATPEEIRAANVFKGIESREGYIAWVRDYKSLIKDLADEARDLKAKRRDQDIWVQASAQAKLAVLADATTALIQKRRLGKIWSAAEAAARRAEAA